MKHMIKPVLLGFSMLLIRYPTGVLLSLYLNRVKLYLGAVLTKVPLCSRQFYFPKKNKNNPIIPLSSQISTAFASKHAKGCSITHRLTAMLTEKKLLKKRFFPKTCKWFSIEAELHIHHRVYKIYCSMIDKFIQKSDHCPS